jgi:hypothetical protein
VTTQGALLAGAGRTDAAHARYRDSLALAASTGMRFYDAETKRLQARLCSDEDATVSELHAALELARSQGARPFELRIALDLHELLGSDGDPVLKQATCAFPKDASFADLEVARSRVMNERRTVS